MRNACAWLVLGCALTLGSSAVEAQAPLTVVINGLKAPGKMLALEAYYRPGPLLVGTEYFFQWANAPEAGDPFFHGGEAVVSWLPTGETRTYNTRGGFFNAVSPAKTVFEGGPGAWEAVLRVSYIDLDGGNLSGGRFWRVTPMVNWHLSDNLRLELAYGYGELNRFDLTGGTQFFQSRLQLTF